MGAAVTTALTRLSSLDRGVLGACLLAVDLMLFGALAVFWEDAGRRKLFSVWRKKPHRGRGS